MPRLLVSVIMVALGLALLLFVWDNRQLRAELTDCQNQAVQEQQVTPENVVPGGEEEAAPAGQTPVTYLYENLTTSEEDSLRALGLENPVAAVDSALRAHRELISYEGVLGGTMDFYGADAVRVLGPDRISAVFSDGHNQGHMLVAYRVGPGGAIEFEVLESQM